MTIRPYVGLDRAGGGIDGDDWIFPDVGDTASDPRWVNRPRDMGTPRSLASHRRDRPDCGCHGGFASSELTQCR